MLGQSLSRNLKLFSSPSNTFSISSDSFEEGKPARDCWHRGLLLRTRQVQLHLVRPAAAFGIKSQNKLGALHICVHVAPGVPQNKAVAAIVEMSPKSTACQQAN